MFKELLKNPVALFWAIVIHIIVLILLIIGFQMNKQPKPPAESVAVQVKGLQPLAEAQTASTEAPYTLEEPKIQPELSEPSANQKQQEQNQKLREQARREAIAEAEALAASFRGRAPSRA